MAKPLEKKIIYGDEGNKVIKYYVDIAVPIKQGDFDNNIEKEVIQDPKRKFQDDSLVLEVLKFYRDHPQRIIKHQREKPISFFQGRYYTKVSTSSIYNRTDDIVIEISISKILDVKAWERIASQSLRDVVLNADTKSELSLINKYAIETLHEMLKVVSSDDYPYFENMNKLVQVQAHDGTITELRRLGFKIKEPEEND